MILERHDPPAGHAAWRRFVAGEITHSEGIGVTSLGHAHPGLTAAIADQAATLLHTSNP